MTATRVTGPEANAPDLRVLSLGAGVQSTVLALMACNGDLPGLDAVIFADTGWEPRAVYDQIERLRTEFARAGISFWRVSGGNLRDDTLNPNHRFVSIPYFTLSPESEVPIRSTCQLCQGGGRDAEDPSLDCILCRGAGTVPDPTGRVRSLTRREREGMGRRQCTYQYKLRPINLKVRELLGAKPPFYRRVPKGQVAEQWIGFSTDEIHRVDNRRRNAYTVKRYPLLDLGMSRRDCERWLQAAGWGHTAKSACVGCPFHGNAQWRDMRDNRPGEWADAIDFDQRIRDGGPGANTLWGQAFLHRSCLPLEQAPIDRVSRREWADRQLRLDDLAETGDPDGCSPYGCRSGSPTNPRRSPTVHPAASGGSP